MSEPRPDRQPTPIARPPREVFLDTSVLVAAASARERRHVESRGAYLAALDAGAVVVTTDLVLAEAHALLQRMLGGAVAIAAVEALRGDPSHEVVHAGPSLFDDALSRWLRPRPDAGFSLCDAVSFEVMRQRRMRRALSLDRHFIAAGFEAVPG